MLSYSSQDSLMHKSFLFLLLSLPFLSLFAAQEYVEPQEVATTEGLPSNLVNQSVCVISGDYTDSVLDIVIPGPEPLVVNRVYISSARGMPWSFNHYDQLLLGSVLYDGTPAYIVTFRQPSGAQLDYLFEKKGDFLKLKKIPFKLIEPKGLTNGSSLLSGKTNLKNQTLDFYPDEEMIVAQSGAGNRKIFKNAGKNRDGWPLCGQISEEKVNGSRIRYEGKGKGISGASKIICENKETKRCYSSIEFTEKALEKDVYLQTLIASDGRKLNYFFKHHHYRIKEKSKHSENSYPIDRFYLCKVDHPYAPPEEYRYDEKALSRDMHIIAKLRDGGRRFINVEYYHTGTNHVGGGVGRIAIEDKDDFRLDRVKKLLAPVGTDSTPIVTHRFDYHATIKKEKKHKKVKEGYTDVYDAQSHKTRYSYDKKHRLTSIIRYSGISPSNYVPYTEECFFWNKEGYLVAKIFKDGAGNIHHARTFTYDSYGNVLTSTLCGKLTGRPSPPILIDAEGNLFENGYERETKTYTYSDDGLNLLLSEKDSAGKTIQYKYHRHSDRIKAKYLSYDGQIRLREFYFYDSNYALEKKIIDDGCQEPSEDLLAVTERHYTLIVPRHEPPIGLPASLEEWVDDFRNNTKMLLKRSTYTYSSEGRLRQQQVFDANGLPVYPLQYDYDLHGNLIRETNAMGIATEKRYDLATDNLVEQSMGNVTIVNSYDFANRLIEQKEIHQDQEYVIGNRFDYLGQCTSIMNPYGHETRQFFDDFGRVIEIHSPKVSLEGILTTPIIKKSYDIAGFPVSLTDANGQTTFIEVNIRGQPTKIIYPDGTKEEMVYSLDGKLVQKTAKNGARTDYIRDSLGRVKEEIVEGQGERKQTINRYNAMHLLESIDPEGNHTAYFYDPAGRVQEIVKNDRKTQHFYDALGRLSEIKEYDGHEPHQYRTTVRKYDNLDRLKEEYLQSAEGQILHFSRYDYDIQGNRTLVQTGDQQIVTEYNTRNQPVKITDGLGHQTHIEYQDHFINIYGQQVLQKIITDPLGYRTIETYDTANRKSESTRMNPLGVKIARQVFSYDLVGNQTKVEEEVIEGNRVVRLITTRFFYNAVNQIVRIIEASGTPEQKITHIRYNAFGQKEILIKPDGIEIDYAYDGFDRLKTHHSSDHSISYLYEYNRLDQVLSVMDQNSGKITKREYFQGNLKRETLANGLSIDYTYDRTGRARTILFPDQTGIEYVYNSVDLKEIHRLINGKRAYTHRDLEHSLSGQVTKSSLPGHGGTVNYRFDFAGRCLSIASAALNQQVPFDGFDALGNLRKYQLQDISYEFDYDDLYQIRGERGHCAHIYSFDSLSNRTSKDGETYQHNSLNQIVKKGHQDLVYDPNGNLIRNGAYEYSYDALNRLVKVAWGGNIALYTYDAFDRRVVKTINGQEEFFLYQGQDEIGCWKNGVCQEMRLMGKNTQSQTAAIEIRGIPYVPLHDLNGNIIALLNLQGEVVERYRYTVYGEREILDSSGARQSKSVVGNPWQYAGKRFDEESGLIAFGMRYYDPNMGRWMTPDPAGFVDGFNLYAYVHNNPLQYSDQFGLFGESLFMMGRMYYASLESNYQKFCVPLGCDQLGHSSSPISHIEMENKLEQHYNFRKKEDDPVFERTRACCINDFIDPKTGQYYNFKKMSEDKRIIYTNGIDNKLEDFVASLLHLAQMTGYNIKGIFCPTYGKTLDMICYKHALNDHIAYEGSRELKKQIEDFHANSSLGATMMIICHSRGAVYTRNGMMDCSQELRNRVDIRAIAPGGYIDRSLCKNVVHYASTRDIVPLLDVEGRRRCKDTLITLQPHPAAPWFDHGFMSPTYAETLEMQMKKYLRK